MPGDVGRDSESDSRHGPDDCLDGPFVPGVIGGADLSGELATDLCPDLLCDLANVLWRNPIDDSYQHVRQNIVAVRGEVDVDLFGRHRVVLRWAAGTGPGAAVRAAMGHVEVPIGGEFVEMVPGDVRVDVEEFGDTGGAHGAGGLSDRDVDRPAGGVPQRRSEIADRVAELSGSRGNWLRHAENYSFGSLVNTICIGEIWLTGQA